MDLRERITLNPDPVWTSYYKEQRDRILDLVDRDAVLGTFHVGSTAIPDVPGKPALDIILVFSDSEALSDGADDLAGAEYELIHRDSDCAVAIEWRDERTVFVKMHTLDDPKVRSQLIFRDYLRDHPEARKEYEQVKRQAVVDHPNNEEAYTNAKNEVVASVLEQAHNEGYGDDLPRWV